MWCRVLLLLLLLLFSLIYHRVFVPWYVSGASGVPHHSGFRFQTVVHSLLYVMFPVQLLFAENLRNGFLELFPDVILIL
jgi:hypothetical protein